MTDPIDKIMLEQLRKNREQQFQDELQAALCLDDKLRTYNRLEKDHRKWIRDGRPISMVSLQGKPDPLFNRPANGRSGQSKEEINKVQKVKGLVNAL